ncbi:MAG: hypothetical protein ABUS57_05060 [Pseudomonadota bacterium]
MKSDSTKLGFGMTAGLVLGAVLGAVVLGSVIIGAAAGLSLGVVIALILDRADRMKIAKASAGAPRKDG